MGINCGCVTVMASRGLMGGCMRASGGKLGLCDGRGVKSGLCDSQRPWFRASGEFMRAVKGYIAKLGVVDLFEGHLVKVKRKNVKYIFIGKVYRYVLVVSILDYLIFNVFISL